MTGFKILIGKLDPMMMIM